MGSERRRAEARGRLARRAFGVRRLARVVRGPLRARTGFGAPGLTVANRLALLFASFRNRIHPRTRIAARTGSASTQTTGSTTGATRTQYATRKPIAARTKMPANASSAARIQAAALAHGAPVTPVPSRADNWLHPLLIPTTGPERLAMNGVPATSARPAEGLSGSNRIRRPREGRERVYQPFASDHPSSSREIGRPGIRRLARSAARLFPLAPRSIASSPLRSAQGYASEAHPSKPQAGVEWNSIVPAPASGTKQSTRTSPFTRRIGGNELRSLSSTSAQRDLNGGSGARSHSSGATRVSRDPGSRRPPAPQVASIHQDISRGAEPSGALVARSRRRDIAPGHAPRVRSLARSERFLAELGNAASEQTSPLPPWAAPLVRSIPGAHPAKMTTGSATRRALRSVGAVAATTGSTIHLAAAPRRSPASIAVLAHELSHVADRSATPRFYGGDLADHGEGRARALGTLAAFAAGRAPALGTDSVAAATSALTSRSSTGPSKSVSSLPVGGFGGFFAAGTEAGRDVVMRSSATEPDELVEGPGNTDAPAVAGVEPAELGTQNSAREGHTPGGSADVAPAPREASRTASGLVPGAVSAATDSHSRMGELLEALEERVLAELERRGGRWAGVF